MLNADQALDLLRRSSDAATLVAVLERHPEARLVGGAVRDLLRGVVPAECDVVVAGDPAPVARALGEVVAEHSRFGTMQVRIGELRCDLAAARSERYAHPGALPDVAAASLDEDLRRRDFTVNAMSLSPAAGLVALPGALEDLAARRLKVLHDDSFADDPTRLFRLVRYSVRLGFLPDERTDRMAHQAVGRGALTTISAERRTAELRLLLAEPDPLSALHAAQHLGLVSGLTIDPVVAERALALLGDRGSRAITLLGACADSPDWGSEFAFNAEERAALARCAVARPLGAVPPLAPSDVDAALAGEPVEAVCVAGARGDGTTAARWLSDWSGWKLEIDGDDLLEAGVTAGPELGRVLKSTRAALLDGRVGRDRAEQLAFATGRPIGAASQGTPQLEAGDDRA